MFERVRGRMRRAFFPHRNRARAVNLVIERAEESQRASTGGLSKRTRELSNAIVVVRAQTIRREGAAELFSIRDGQRVRTGIEKVIERIRAAGLDLEVRDDFKLLSLVGEPGVNHGIAFDIETRRD